MLIFLWICHLKAWIFSTFSNRHFSVKEFSLISEDKLVFPKRKILDKFSLAAMFWKDFRIISTHWMWITFAFLVCLCMYRSRFYFCPLKLSPVPAGRLYISTLCNSFGAIFLALANEIWATCHIFPQQNSWWYSTWRLFYQLGLRLSETDDLPWIFWVICYCRRTWLLLSDINMDSWILIIFSFTFDFIQYILNIQMTQINK